MREAAIEALSFPAPFGLTVRFAMKANPTRTVLRLFDSMGICIDASSGFEASRAISAGIAGDRILLTAQELPGNLKGLLGSGVGFNACSLRQLEEFGKAFRSGTLGLRLNLGVGSGFSDKTKVAGSQA
ncbi:diaminopimelate decarboxylase, partial [Patescibacteria group bacterium]